jgi:hypothetical protein
MYKQEEGYIHVCIRVYARRKDALCMWKYGISIKEEGYTHEGSTLCANRKKGMCTKEVRYVHKGRMACAYMQKSICMREVWYVHEGRRTLSCPEIAI